ncbi:hypothetical protein C0J52_00836 [Blattella germanica]|nr:hypothetical protein C0J52_00836 [Blattella germanica]
MAVNSILLDFSVTSTRLTNAEESRGVQDDMESVLANFVPGLKKKSVYDFGGSFMALLTADRGTVVTLRGFPQGLVTCNIEYYKDDEEKPLLLFEQIRALESRLKAKLSCCRSKIFPPIKRGASLDVYLTTSVNSQTRKGISSETVLEEKSFNSGAQTWLPCR